MFVCLNGVYAYKNKLISMIGVGYMSMVGDRTYLEEYKEYSIAGICKMEKRNTYSYNVLFKTL